MNTTAKTKRPRATGRYGFDMSHLEAWRVYRVMSKVELALAAGLSKTAIGNYEAHRYNARAETVRKIAKALNITPEQLTREDPPIAAAKGA